MTTSLSKDSKPAVRTFLAVEVPESILKSVASMQRTLAPHASALKIVNPEVMHITMRFLGAVSSPRLIDVEAAARAGAEHAQPFILRLTSVGTFPGGGRTPRVIWVGLDKDAGDGAFAGLFDELEAELASRGFGRESRSFAPHLTLARVRADRPRADYDALRSAIEELRSGFDASLEFTVGELVVFRSDLSPQGPRYTALARLPLSA
jgi:2'-5' RNA ligase